MGWSSLIMFNAAIISEQSIRWGISLLLWRDLYWIFSERLRFYLHSDRHAMRYPRRCTIPQSRRIVGKRGTRRNAHFVKRLRPHLELLFLMGHSIHLVEQSYGIRTALQTGLQQSSVSRWIMARISILSHPLRLQAFSAGRLCIAFSSSYDECFL